MDRSANGVEPMKKDAVRRAPIDEAWGVCAVRAGRHFRRLEQVLHRFPCSGVANGWLFAAATCPLSGKPQPTLETNSEHVKSCAWIDDAQSPRLPFNTFIYCQARVAQSLLAACRCLLPSCWWALYGASNEGVIPRFLGPGVAWYLLLKLLVKADNQ